MNTYLILGGSSGIGLAVSRKLAKENDIVIVSHSEKKLEQAKEMIDPKHCCETFACDLGKPENITHVFQFIKERNMRLDGMVYCAGVAPLCLLKDNDISQMENVFRLNLFSFIEACRYFYQEDISVEGSKIVAIASITAHSSGYRQVLYGSSKAAMVAASRLMAKELMNRKIKINCLSPGSVLTDLLMGLYESRKALEAKVQEKQPLGVIPPERVADAVMMLLSPVADYISGNEFVYDGGFLL